MAKQQITTPDYVQLEARVLFNAVPLDVPTVEDLESVEDLDTYDAAETDGLDQFDFDSLTDWDGAALLSDSLHDAPQSLSNPRSTSGAEIVFIDGSVENLAQLLNDHALLDRDGVDIILLDPEQDGVEQITNALQDRSGLDAVHFVTHGNSGEVQLGNSSLNSLNLEAHAGQVAQWGDSLSSSGDILFYGCDLASDPRGEEFVEALSALCDCDVAASDDITGHEDLGGDWDFEFFVGQVETEVAFSIDVQQNWMETLATVTVTNPNDVVNGTTTTLAALLANDGGDGISLREAIIAAGGDISADTILLGSGTHAMDSMGSHYSINTDIEIIGAADGSTIIDATGLSDRVFDLAINTLTLRNLEIFAGSASDSEGGGAVLVRGGSSLVVDDVLFKGNSASRGGAIRTSGTVVVTNSTFDGNIATTNGGAIAITSGSTVLDTVTFFDNASDQDGGAVHVSSSVASVDIDNATISGNQATRGGGIYLNSGSANIQHATIKNNSASTDGGGLYRSGGTIEIGTSIVAGNTATNSGNEGFATIVSLGDNIFGDGAGDASSLNGIDPGDLVDQTGLALGPLADNGGAVQTHELLPTSTVGIDGTSSTDPTDGRGYYLNDGARDVGSYEVGATAVPGPESLPTALSSGIELNIDGGNDAYLIASDADAVLSGRTSMTFETTFSLDGSAVGDLIVPVSYTTSSGDRFQLAINNTGPNAGDLSINVNGFNEDSGAIDYRGLSDGDIHTLSFSWDNTFGDWAVYVDGQLVDSGTSLADGSTIASGGTLLFGQDQDSVNGGFQTNEQFNGTLYDVRFWNDVRTESEIAAFAGIKIDPANLPSGLVANWQMGLNGNQVADIVSESTATPNRLTVAHASSAGFTTSTPVDDLNVDEDSVNGTSVGYVIPTASPSLNAQAIANTDSTLTYDATTGKLYKLVEGDFTWITANADAATEVLYGETGQLVTIRSAYENSIVQGIAQDAASPEDIWIGASDQNTEGDWHWYADGVQNNNQRFWIGEGTGNAQPGFYTNWNGAEPNGDNPDEHYARMAFNVGDWRDTRATVNTLSYVVEWDANDVANNFTFSLSDDANGIFAIDPNTGEITLIDTSQLDFTNASSHNITVEVTDGNGNVYPQTLPIVVNPGVEQTTLTITAPASTATTEDTAFLHLGNDVIQIDDGLPTDNFVRVELSVGNGLLTLGTNTLTPIAGANGSSSMVIEGLESDINAALLGLEYDPLGDYNGSDTLNITLAVDSGLEGHFAFDGDATNQSAGSTVDGLRNGNADFTMDPTRGQVLQLNGNGDYVEVASDFGNPSDVTLAAWINPNFSGMEEIISLGDNVAFRVQDNGDLRGFYYTSAGLESLFSGVNVPTGWSHVAMTFDDAANSVRLYLNGVEIDSAVDTNSLVYTRGTTTLIGRHGFAETDKDFDGLIDDARIYSRALSAEEIAAIATGQAEVTESVAITVGPENDAPVLNNIANPLFSAITEDDINNVGQPVSAMLASVGDPITDIDGLAVPEGIAVVSHNQGNGSWEYSTDLGGTWQPVGSVSDSSALLLRETDMLRLNPDGIQGTNADIQFRAWDQTTGVTGTKVDVNPTGGTTAFSDDIATAQITVTNVSDAPILSNIDTDTITYSSGAAATLLDVGGDAFITDVDTANFGGSQLIVEITNAATAEDTLTVLSGVAPANQISVSGQNILYGGTPIGSFATTTDGANGTVTLTANFNANANLASIAQVAQLIAYENTDAATPNTTNRNINFTFFDGDGGTSAVSTVTVNVEVPTSAAAIWFSSAFDVTDSVAPGLSDWADQDVIQIGDPNLVLEIGDGSSGTSNGTFSEAVDFNAFAGTGAETDALHYVASSITAFGVNLEPGDLLFSAVTNLPYTSTNSVNPNPGDVYVFQPDTAGDYSSGTFQQVVDASTLGIGSTNAFTLVEADTIVGGQLLARGDFLFADGGNDIRWYDTSTGTDNVLIDGAGLSLASNIWGIELVESSTTIGGVTLNSGEILMAVHSDDASIANNNLAVTNHDLVRLDVISAGNGTTSANASILFDGSDVGITTAERPDALTLTTTAVSIDQIPTVDLNGNAAGAGNTVVFTENDGPTSVAPSATVNDFAEGDITSLNLDAIGFQSTAASELLLFGGVTIDGGTATSGTVTVGSTTFFYLYDGGDAFTFTNNAGGSISTTDIEQLIHTIQYQNLSDSTTAGNIDFEFTVQDSAIQTSGIETSVLTIVPVNDAPSIAVNTGLTVSETAGQTAITMAMLNEGDVDDSGAELTYTLLTPPTLGTLSHNGLALNVNDTFTQADIDTGLLTFSPTGDGNDSFNFSLEDGGEDGATPALGTFDITITLVNNAPFVDLDADDSNGTPGRDYSTTLTKGFGPVSLTDEGVIGDTDGTIQELVVDITNAVAIGPEGISYTLPTNISVVDGTPIAPWTFSNNGNATNADFQALLDSLQYFNNANPPGEFVRDITFVANDGQTDSLVATAQVDVIDNAAPIQTVNTGTTVAEGGQAFIVGSELLFVDDLSPAPDVTYTVTSNPANGFLAVSGVQTISFTQSDIDAALLAYVHDGSETVGDSFDFIVQDPQGNGSITRTFDIVVTPVNDDPVGTNDAYATAEDTSLVVDAVSGVLSNDSDAEDDSLVAVIASQPTNGNVNLNADGSFTYTPNSNFSGIDSFQYEVSDGNGRTDQSTVTINVGGSNDDPVAINDTYSVGEDSSLTVTRANGVLANDSDAENDDLLASIVSQPTNGTVNLSDDGSFTYTPIADFFGTDSFEYQVSDGNGGTAQGTVLINVDGFNDPPLATNDNYTASEDSMLSMAPQNGVLANDFDPENDTLLASIVSQPANGTLNLNDDGSFDYTPNANFVGLDSFEYQINDGNGGTAQATAQIVVNNANDPPIAVDDAFATLENQPLTGDLLANDSDLDGDSLNTTLVALPNNGLVTINPDGTFTYTPDPDFVGNDSFVYQVDDGNNATDLAAVEITISPVVGDNPTAVDDAFAINEDAILNGSVLLNDVDPNSDQLVVSTTPIQGPNNGVLTLNADGTFTFAPATNFHGTDSFTYEVSDGNGGTDQATVTIAVSPDNDPPIAGDDSFTTTEDTTLSGSVLLNDSDPEADALLVNTSPVSGPNNGSVTFNSDGTFTYQPAANFAGSDSFVYLVADGNGGSAQAQVDVIVTPVNDAPVANDDSFAIVEGGSLGSSVLSNDTDADGDNLTVTLVGGPAHGSLTFNQNGGFSYVHDGGESVSDSFTYEVTDPTGAASTAMANISIEAINDAPTANSDDLAGTSGQALVIQPYELLANDFDSEGTALDVNVVAGPTNGNLVENVDGSLTYNPDPGFVGVDSFTYAASDGEILSSPVTVLISVGDAPGAGDPGTAPGSDTLLPGAGLGGPGSTGGGNNSFGSQNSDPSNNNSGLDDLSTSEESSEVEDRDDGVGESNNTTDGDVSDLDMAPPPSRSEHRLAIAPTTEDSTNAQLTLHEVSAQFQGSGRLDLDTSERDALASGLIYRLQKEIPKLIADREYSLVGELQDAHLIWDNINLLREQVRESLANRTVNVGAATAVTGAATLGYLLWTIRGGHALIAALVASGPTWKLLDPLPVMAGVHGGQSDDEDSSLADLAQKSNQENTQL